MVFITVKISIAGDGGRGEGWYGGRYSSKGGSSYSGLRILLLSATILAKAPPSCPSFSFSSDAGCPPMLAHQIGRSGAGVRLSLCGMGTRPSHRPSGDGGPRVAQVNLPEARQRSDGGC